MDPALSLVSLHSGLHLSFSPRWPRQRGGIYRGSASGGYLLSQAEGDRDHIISVSADRVFAYSLRSCLRNGGKVCTQLLTQQCMEIRRRRVPGRALFALSNGNLYHVILGARQLSFPLDVLGRTEVDRISVQYADHAQMLAKRRPRRPKAMF